MQVAFVFPGQGAQHPGMATGLYGREPTFTAAMERVFQAFGPTGRRLREDWLAGRPVDDVTRSTPLLFAVDYALAQLVQSWGVTPAAVLGHSIGEVAAATVAGVLDLDEIAPVIAVRVDHLATAPAGGMLAVAASPAEVARYVGGDLVVGAINGPRQVILSGPTDAVATVAAALRRDGVVCRQVPALSPFHSPAMAEAAARGAHLVDKVAIRLPRLAVYSAFLGRRMTWADATDRAFWVRQPAAPVLFWPALEALLADGSWTLVEAGPGDSLTTLVRQHPAVSKGRSNAVALLPHRRPDDVDDLAAVLAVRDRLAPMPIP